MPFYPVDAIEDVAIADVVEVCGIILVLCVVR